MPVTFDTKKKVEFILAKRNLINVRARVGAAFDVSYSAKSLYERGDFQKVAERLLALALRFDDNGEMDNWIFSDTQKQVSGVNDGTIDGFVDREIIAKDHRPLWGGTEYSEIIEEVRNFYFPPAGKKGIFGGLFGRKPSPRDASGDPAILYFMTDGENDRNDCPKVVKLLQEMTEAKTPLYLVMIGIGNERSFDFIKQIADHYPNVGYVHVADLDKISDDDLYERVVSEELATWLKARQAA